MLYQCKREPPNDDEANILTDAYNAFGKELVVCTLLDTGLGLSEFADLKKGIPTIALQTD